MAGLLIGGSAFPVVANSGSAGFPFATESGDFAMAGDTTGNPTTAQTAGTTGTPPPVQTPPVTTPVPQTTPPSSTPPVTNPPASTPPGTVPPSTTPTLGPQTTGSTGTPTTTPQTTGSTAPGTSGNSPATTGGPVVPSVPPAIQVPQTVPPKNSVSIQTTPGGLINGGGFLSQTQTPNSIPTGQFPVFGLSYFSTARASVDARRALSATGAPTVIPPNQLGTIVAPDTTASSNNPSPDRYQLGVGDSVNIKYSSQTFDQKEIVETVDSRGLIQVPESGKLITARGLTLAQFEQHMIQELGNVIRNARVQVTLGPLRMIPVQILGEAYAPGAYQMPSTVTLFNALYSAGGPSDAGSLRRIQLKRGGTVTNVDLYRLMIRGDASQDIPLQPGDIINIPPAETRVTVFGEVKRQAIFELLPNERLRDSITLAGGVRASGVTQRVLVTSVKPGVGHTLVDVDLIKPGSSNNPPLFDFDTVEVFSIRPIITNAVSIEGAIDQPRQFALSPGMRVSTLVESARGLLPDASKERADLFRLNPDYTSTLVPINLGEALKHNESADVLLRPNDRLVIYHVSDVTWLGNRQVTVAGAVRNPGVFVRANGMTLRDLLIQAHGLTPDAFGPVAFLRRTNPDGTPGPILRINVGKLAAGNLAENVVLADLDQLTVQTVQDAQQQPDQLVSIDGAVQRPGTFPRSLSMTIRDLIGLAGNTTLDASNRVILQKTQLSGQPGAISTLDLGAIFRGDSKQNLILDPRDKVTVQSLKQSQFIPDQTVSIQGAIANPGTFTKASNMTVQDLLDLGGPALPNVSPRMFLQRTNLDGTIGPLTVLDLNKVLAGDPANNIALQVRDQLTVYTIAQAGYIPEQSVAIAGSVQSPGTYQKGSTMTVKDLVELAGGPLPDAYQEKAYLQRTNLDGTQGPLVIVNLKKALQGDTRANLVLQTKDVLSVYNLKDSAFQVDETVTIQGAVQRPGTFPRSSNMTIRDLIGLAGGPLPTASDDLQVGHSWVPKGSPLERYRISDVLGAGPAGDKPLQKGDVVVVADRSDIEAHPRVVIIQGEVAKPGPYILSGKGDRLSSLIRQAGGLTAKGYAPATQLARDPKYFVTPAQSNAHPAIFATLQQLATVEYQKASAESDLDKLRVIFSAGSVLSNVGGVSSLTSVLGGQAATNTSPLIGSGTAIDSSIGAALSRNWAQQARQFGQADLSLGGNLSIDLVDAIRHPGSQGDLTLEDGDVISVPQRPTTVSIVGAVIRPSAIRFEAGRSLQYYLDHCGGLATDADPRSIILVRSNGEIIRYRYGLRVELGDSYLIPTKVTAVRLTQAAAASTASSFASQIVSGLLLYKLLK